MKRRLFLALPGAGLLLPAQGRLDDALLEAMSAELERSLRLKIAGETPYFIEYMIEDGVNFSCQASLGGLLGSSVSPYRVPRVMVRVGSYEFDNTNFVYTGQIRGARYDSNRWPLEFNRTQVQQDLWLATDRAYKAAVQEITLKKSALQNITLSEKLNDFAKQAPLVKILPAAKSSVDEKKWNDVARRLSAVLGDFPKVLDSRVEIEDSASTFYYANTEGTRVRVPELVCGIRVRAQAFASDGAVIRDHRFFHGFRLEQLPSEAVMRQEIEAMGRHLTALVDASPGEAYTGPVLFESTAAAQLFGQVFGAQLQAMRDPVSVPGRPVNAPPSELESRLSGRVLPDTFTVTDDPNAVWKGRPLLGNCEADYEGVAPQKVVLVENGTLKGLLYSRQPVRGHEGSNGHGRMPGGFGAAASVPTNLIVECKDGVSPGDLKKKLLELVTQRRKPYGILVRRMDYPSSASMVELRRLANAMQGSGSSRPVSSPLEIFKVYPDGREEPIRGVRFRGVNVRLLRDILAVGNDAAPMEYLLNTAPLALMGAGGYVVGTSVVCPSLLFDEMDLERPQEERPRPPVVAPPPLESGA
ncbi:MAG TPA: metallopeptidase TldD-related protein [Bryobacteraceae bacterium]|nr:metallopeptidase TldD-related protein [Bryobacteraceae bacterium]